MGVGSEIMQLHTLVVFHQVHELLVFEHQHLTAGWGVLVPY
jgi:hypothetical protein